MAFAHKWNANGDGTHDFNVAGNWDVAGPPTTTDSFLIALGTRGCEITTNMNQFALDPTHMSIGDEFKGVLGDPGSPFIIGDATLITINAPEAKTLCIQSSANQTVATLIVYASGVEAYSCWLSSDATASKFTDVYLLGSGMVHFAAGIDIDNLYVAAGNLVITAAGTIDYMYATGGKIINHAALGTVEVSAGALLDHRGSGATYGSATKITGYKGATVLLNSRNGTFSSIIAYAGSYFDGTGVGYENTLSAGEIHKGAVVKLNENWDVNANVKGKGGIYVGPSGPTQEIDPQPL